MMKVSTRLPALLLIFAVCFGGFQLTIAQQDTPNVFAVSESPQNAYILSFSMGREEPNVVYQIGQVPQGGQFIQISPDGQWIYIQRNTLNGQEGSINRIGGAETKFAFTGDAAFGIFSTDSKYLVHIAATRNPNGGGRQLMRLLNLEAGTEVIIVGNLIDTTGSGNFRGFIAPMSWNPDSGVMLVALVEFDNIVERSLGFYLLDMSQINPQTPDTYPMPELEFLGGKDEFVGRYYLSPDGKMVAYVYLDQLPAGFDPITSQSIDQLPANRVAVLDTTTGERKASFNAQGNRSIFTLAWVNDDTLIYAEGDFNESSTSRADFYQVSLRGSPESKGSFDAGGRIVQMLVCGETLYLTAFSNTGGRLFNMPTADLTDITELSHGGLTAYLLACASADSWREENIVENLETGGTNSSGGDPTQIALPTPVSPLVGNLDLKTFDFSGGDATRGEELYISKGCDGCHNPIGGVAASWDASTQGMYTRAVNVRLADPANAGKTVEQYLAEATLDPNAYIIPGAFPDVAPNNYRRMLTQAELRHLVAYMMTLK